MSEQKPSRADTWPNGLDARAKPADDHTARAPPRLALHEALLRVGLRGDVLEVLALETVLGALELREPRAVAVQRRIISASRRRIGTGIGMIRLLLTWQAPGTDGTRTDVGQYPLPRGCPRHWSHCC